MKMKKILASVVAVSAVMSAVGNNVFAYDIKNEAETALYSDSILRYTSISKFNPSVTSNGTIKVSLILRDSLDFSITLELEQYINGSWESIDSWSLNGNYSGTISESCSLESGERYRACAYVEVYDEYGDLVESTTKYSSAVTAR